MSNNNKLLYLIKWKLLRKKVFLAHFKIEFQHLRIFAKKKLQLADYEIILAVTWACLTRCGVVLTTKRRERGLVLLEATNCSTRVYGLKTLSISSSV